MSLQIRLGRTDSVYSVDRENSLDVELKNTSKPIHHNNIKETIDIYEQYKKEREESERYRLILTVHPFCTNVLFNPLTEIIKDEGSDSPIVATDNRAVDLSGLDVYGKENPLRRDMIKNTEYSRDDIGFEYHPGYDIFDNHILKNLGFKVVNQTNASDDGNFNTDSDYARDSDGTVQEIWIRKSIDDVVLVDKHLYNSDELLDFEGSITANLSEENGWWGFGNTSNIENRYLDRGEKKSLNIEKVLNNHKSCEFIDMYPDRTLYSFAPKWNKFRRRLEYNWDIVLTYPHSMDYDMFELDKAKGYYGLPLFYYVQDEGEDEKNVYMEEVTNLTGNKSYVFRSVLKHGLKGGDYIRLYYKDGDEWKSFYEDNNKDFRVSYVGNLGDGDEDYYFVIYDDDLTEFIGEGLNAGKEVRFSRVDGNTPSKYAFRKFKKLPNFKWKEKEFDGTEAFDDYIDGNGINGVAFDNEWYKLAFAHTIYGDEVAQITFTDTIDMSNMIDKDGRPICEIYATVLKANRGHDEWYNGGENGKKNEKVEFSHCFGPLQAGLETSHEFGDSEGAISVRKAWGDVRLITDSDNNDNPYDDDITFDADNEFYGDVVEYNAVYALPKQLQMFEYRFNTMQRELVTDEYNEMVYSEFENDDYSGNEPFSISDVGRSRLPRREGYYYKPHYLIRLKGWGAVNQGSHIDVGMKKVYLRSEGDLYLVVETLRSTKVNVGDTILMVDNVNNKTFYFTVAYTPNRLTMYLIPRIDPNIKNDDGSVVPAWEQLIELLKAIYTGNFVPLDVVTLIENGSFKLLRVNPDIPAYADKLDGRNTYFWRNPVKSGDVDTTEVKSFNFANGAFYLSEDINLFLKRQDPHNESGLYCAEDIPSDIAGITKKESNYNYKTEQEYVC